MPDGSDIDALRTALAAAEAEVIDARAKATEAEAQIAALKLMIEKLRRALYGQRSERKQRLLDQLELQLDELEASATEDELAAEQAAAGTTQVKGFTRRRRSGRKPFPAHLPRERVVVPRTGRLCVLRFAEALEDRRGHHRDAGGRSRASWKVVQTVREKFTCRHCEKISPSRRRRSTRHHEAGRVSTCWR